MNQNYYLLSILGRRELNVKALEGPFDQEKDLVGALSVIRNLRMDLQILWGIQSHESPVDKLCSWSPARRRSPRPRPAPRRRSSRWPRPPPCWPPPPLASPSPPWPELSTKLLCSRLFLNYSPCLIKSPPIIYYWNNEYLANHHSWTPDMKQIEAMMHNY